MQLSVSTSPAEPNLASLLLGGDCSSDATAVAAPGGSAQPFADLFAELSPDSAAPVAATPLSVGEAAPDGVVEDEPLPWVGSSLPDVAAAPLNSPVGTPITTPATKSAGTTAANQAGEEQAGIEQPESGCQPTKASAEGKPATRSSATQQGRPTRAARRHEENATTAASQPWPQPALNELTVTPQTPSTLTPALPLEAEGGASTPENLGASRPMAMKADGTPAARPMEVKSDDAPASRSMEVEADDVPAARPIGEAVSQTEMSPGSLPAKANAGHPRRGVSPRVEASGAGTSTSASSALAPMVAASAMANEASPASSAGAQSVSDSSETQVEATRGFDADMPRSRRVVGERQAPFGPTAATSESDNSAEQPGTVAVLDQQPANVAAEAPQRFAPADLLARQFAPVSTGPKAMRANGREAAMDSIPVFRSVRQAAVEASVPASLAVNGAYRAESATGAAPTPWDRSTAITGQADTPMPIQSLASAPTSAPEIEADESEDASTPEVRMAVASAPAMRDVQAPAPKVEKAGTGRGAKIAAGAPKLLNAEKSGEVRSDKNFLSTEEEEVADGQQSVGTSVAKTGIDMMNLHSDRPASADVHAHVPASVSSVMGAERSAHPSVSSSLSAEATGTAQRAVEAVLTAADRFSAGERHTVNLQFSVGGNDLNVRVELRADEVHATFRTDSPELRSALAHEWQATNGAAEGERSLRFAAPVFSSNSSQPDAGGFSSFAGGDSSSRQRESGARRSGDESFEIAGIRSSQSSSRGLSETVSTSSASVAPAATSTTSRRLHVRA